MRLSRPPVLALLLAAAVGLVGLAQATQVTFWRTTCPLDGTETRVFEKVSSDTMGGWDSDGCRYSMSGQWREYELSTCPKDLFTLGAKDFMGTFDEDTLARLRAESTRVLADYPNPDTIQIWDRYEIAARFYRILGKDEAFLANLYLKASWTARDAAVGTYAGLDGPQAAARLLEAGAQEVAKVQDAAVRKTLLYNLARVAQRAGENALRDQYLDRFEAEGNLDAQEQEALARFRRMSHEVEPRYQDLALGALARWQAGPNLPAASVVQSTWLQADLLRRRDRPQEALALYKKVLASPEAPDELKDMARFFERRLSAKP